jgi:hypothetical protein
VELVALSDNLGLVELFAEFLAFVTDGRENKPLLYQDTMSVIMMVSEGGGLTRTKHLSRGGAAGQSGSQIC